MRINKFWIVTLPNEVSELGDICFETDMVGLKLQFLGGLDPQEIAGVFTEQLEAEFSAQLLLNNRE